MPRIPPPPADKKPSPPSLVLLKWLLFLALVVGGMLSWPKQENAGPAVPPPVAKPPAAQSTNSTISDTAQPRPAPRPVKPTAATVPAPAPVPAASQPSSTIVRNVVVYDLRGRKINLGDVDLAPTLERIKAGERLEHRNDGSVFHNYPASGGRGCLLPQKPDGYYHEYVHPTPGVSGPGPQRIIIGGHGEIYYTPDHYESFIPIQAATPEKPTGPPAKTTGSKRSRR